MYIKRTRHCLAVFRVVWQNKAWEVCAEIPIWVRLTPLKDLLLDRVDVNICRQLAGWLTAFPITITELWKFAHSFAQRAKTNSCAHYKYNTSLALSHFMVDSSGWGSGIEESYQHRGLSPSVAQHVTAKYLSLPSIYKILRPVRLSLDADLLLKTPLRLFRRLSQIPS